LSSRNINIANAFPLPSWRREYLAQVLAENDKAAFLVALKDVVEATGGMSVMAKRVGLKRPSLYKVLSKEVTPPWKRSKPSWQPWACGLR
jgi:probable addiction module antidote protein